MADIVERLIELISTAEPLEHRVSDAVAGFLERTADKLSRLEGDSSASGMPHDVPGEGDSQAVPLVCGSHPCDVRPL